MINQNLYIFVARLFTLKGVVVRKYLRNCVSLIAHTILEARRTPLKVTSGFLIKSHHISPVCVAAQFLAPLQFKRLLDQITVLIGQERKFPSGAFLSLFFLPFFFSLSLFNNLSSFGV